MNEPDHIVLDSSTTETAEEYLRRISRPAPPAPAAAGPGQARRASAPARIPTPAVGGRGARPWVAASSSLVVWGGGQWLNGQRSLALLLLSLQALALAAGYFLAMTWGRLVGLGSVFQVEEPTLAAGVFALAGLLPVLWVAGVLQAYARATHGPKPWRFAGPAAAAALASLVVPGCGQLMNGQMAKGGIFLTLWGTAGYGLAASLRFPELWTAYDRTFRPLAGMSLTVVQLGMLAVVGLVWIVATYDALLTARTLAD